MKEKEKKRIIWGSIGFVVVLVAILLYYFLYASHYETTDDAFIEGHPVPVSFRVPGYVQAVYINDNQKVKVGDLLAELDPSDFEATLEQAKANLAAAEAEALAADTDYRRYLQLRQRNDVSQQKLDHATAKAQEATARVALARAELKQAELNLSYTKLFAPHDGKVTEKSVESGAFIQVGQPLFSLVLSEFWVIANFKEDQITYMRPGQPVKISIDAYPGKKYNGTVQSIQSGSGAAFSLFPPENATGNYVKVVQRVPVKITFDDPWDSELAIGPGLSVEPRVKVK